MRNRMLPYDFGDIQTTKVMTNAYLQNILLHVVANIFLTIFLFNNINKWTIKELIHWKFKGLNMAEKVSRF